VETSKIDSMALSGFSCLWLKLLTSLVAHSRANGLMLTARYLHNSPCFPVSWLEREEAGVNFLSP
jgi:hypothetical protein